MSSSSTRSRNFRRRGDGDEDDNDAESPSQNKTPAPPPASRRPTARLSFAEDEEAGVTSPLGRSNPSSSSSSSHRKGGGGGGAGGGAGGGMRSRGADGDSSLPYYKKITPSPSSSSSLSKSKSKERLPPTLSNVVPQAGSYTAAHLVELQKNTRTLARPAPPPPSLHHISSSNNKKSSSSSSTPITSSQPSSAEPPKIILKGQLKPPTYDDEEDEDDGEDKGQKVAGSLDYPDKETINKIKAQRERMRQAAGSAAAPDFISLDAAPNVHVASQGLSDDEDDEEPEFTTRVAMVGKIKDSPPTHRAFQQDTAADNARFFVNDHGDGNDDDVDNNGVVVNARKMLPNSAPATYPTSISTTYAHGPRVAAAGEGEDEDEEDKIWEEEQVRKGLGKRMDDASAANKFLTGATANITSSMMPNQHHHQQTSTSISSISGSLGASQGMDGLSIPQQAEVARKAMQDNLTRLKETHGRSISSLKRTDENLSASLMNITALEKSLSAAGEKFIFMQKLRDFVCVICEFLQHKAPFIEELEDQMQKLHEQRASAILERRTADNDDEMMEVEVAIKAAMLVFSERGNSATMITAATSAAQAATAALKEQANLPVELDELGRDINRQKRMDLKRRAEARKHRKDLFELKKLSTMEVDGSDQKVEGESSTDESDSETMAYQDSRVLLLQTADQIFSDASEEYSQLSIVVERFERWKKEYSTSYHDAYMSLSVPAIFSPYVRLELLKWDPLHEDAGFFNMKWHSLLFNYGLPDDGSDLNPDDADGNLVPVLVEKVAIPILHHQITHCWDMLSTQETKNAVSATSLVIGYLSPSNEAVIELLAAIRAQLLNAVENIKVPTWSPLVLKAVPSAARVAAYRFGMSVRLLRNICLWKEVLASRVLQELALDELLCGKVLPHVRSIASNIHDAVTRTERIIASLSGVWTGSSVTSDRSHRLQPLVDYVLSLGRILEKKHKSGGAESETGGLARRLKKILVELNDYDDARIIAKAFGLKEAV